LVVNSPGSQPLEVLKEEKKGDIHGVEIKVKVDENLMHMGEENEECIIVRAIKG